MGRRGRGRGPKAGASSRVALSASVLAAAIAIAAAVGCGTSHPRALAAATLVEAQTFPYFPVYWVGRSFDGQPLDAVDGRRSYLTSVGESVYYGDCLHGKGIFGGGSCRLPLQVTTVIWHLHNNAGLGAQYNTLIRGVPAAVYDAGRSIELYSGQVAIDVFSDTAQRAMAAALLLEPVNAPAPTSGKLPAPVYCPELVGAIDAKLEGVLLHLPGHICQRSREAQELKKKL